jgi:ABC-type multidrug transport system fused ATPase/permease subunit
MLLIVYRLCLSWLSASLCLNFRVNRHTDVHCVHCPLLQEHTHLCVTVLTVVWSSLLTYLGTLKASLALHKFLLSNLLRTPTSFFDVTPVGRIINRFAKDVDVMDNTLPSNLRGWTTCFFAVGNLYRKKK